MKSYKEIQTSVATELLKIKAVFLRPQEPFIWASGIKSPIYCDNRMTLAFPDSRKLIETSIAQIVKEKYPNCDGLMGTSTAGIPHAALVADILDLPMGYVRSGAKTHGRNNQIEGFQPQGKKVVVIEDLISTGGSSIEVVDALRDSGAEVLGIVSIFTYELARGIEKLNDAKVENTSLSCFSCLAEVALNSGYIDKTEFLMLKKFQENPNSDWQNL